MTGIVILNYNNSAQTLECLKTLYEHCKEGTYKVCVVDNASGQEQLDVLKEGCREHIIRSDENGGYARGNNLGLEYLAADPAIDTLLVLNDDTRLTSDILTPMRDHLLSHPECGAVFPLVKAPDGSTDRACARRQKSTWDLVLQATCLGRMGVRRREFLPTENLQNEKEVCTQVPPGSCMMLRKEDFRRMGFLDPGTFLYFEEHILAEKLRREGLGCTLLPQLDIIHLGAQTTKKQPSKAVYRHWRHSYLYFMEHYTRIPAVLRLLLRLRTLPKAL